MAGVEKIAKGGNVAEPLAHLGSGCVGEMFGVQPVAGERLAVSGLGLRDLVLVVGKEEIDAARVDVEGVAEVRLAHRGALDVPAGPSAPERRIPGRADFGLTGLLVLPQSKVDDILFVVVVGNDPTWGEVPPIRRSGKALLPPAPLGTGL
jgi:hypothetical protein